ncbi:hypothetical protein OPV22_007671 [Ensete ventricosum]|uniref:C2H2-type domain-containing protein n=1 Tax=Ensete ventricosum TaxID=4639 RepID=A0AAV8RHS6_ENSVE|nr:hypothetical protein OPV22_007671 [Ensete ventricosum]
MAEATTKPEEATVQIVYVERPETEEPETFHIRTLAAVLGSEEAAKDAVIYHYKHASSGFSAKLTQSQVEQLSRQPGVLQVIPSRTYNLHGSRAGVMGLWIEGDELPRGRGGCGIYFAAPISFDPFCLLEDLVLEKWFSTDSGAKMDFKLRRPLEASSNASLSMMSEISRNLKPGLPFVPCDSTNICYVARQEQSFSEFPPPQVTQSHGLYAREQKTETKKQLEPSSAVNDLVMDWNPRLMLSNLSFLEQKIHQVQDIVRSIISQEGRANELAAQQQLVTADLTYIIIQLISTAGTLLPNIKNALLSATPPVGQPGVVANLPENASQKQHEVLPVELAKASEYDELIKDLNCGGEGDELIKCLNNSVAEASDSIPIEDHDIKDYDDGMDGENLPPGSYEVLQLEKEEILAPHTHFCLICGKGFKRDANLRMHMRGHGDEYKTPAALAKPSKEASSEPAIIRRYSCPFVGCKRNKEHKKFQPLKTILCVKNHYKRSHCDKSYTCSRCKTKKFSVIADLKTHEKHCGRDKWICSCGTTFSRKDKLFGHVALFQGHTPAIHMDDAKVSGTSDHAQFSETTNGMVADMAYNFSGNASDDTQSLDIKDVDDGQGYFSPMNFDACNFGGLDEFPRSAYDVSESPFSFLSTGTCSFIPRNGEN